MMIILFSRIRCLIISCLILFYIQGNCQIYSDQITFLSPDVAKMVQYGNLDISHYTGQFKYGIPLYTYEDNDFTIPIELDYLSDGFVPGRLCGIAGLDWTLSCGGMVVRQIIGSPDDKSGNPSGDSNQYLRDGWWVGLNKKKHAKEDILNMSDNVRKTDGETPIKEWDSDYDFQPDLFHFRINGQTGTFIIGNDGTAKCLSGGGYKIDLSGLTEQPNHYLTPSEVVIIDSKGFRYRFAALEYFTPIKYYKDAISTWLLTEITAPNGRKALFEYLPAIQQYIPYLYSSASIILTGEGGAGEPMHANYNQSTYRKALKNVKIDNTVIQFNCSPSKDKLQLNSILVKHSQQQVRKIQFSYQYQDSWRFLKKLIIDDTEKFTFDYSLSAVLPDRSTQSLDHWGFWRGGYDTSSVLTADVVKDGNSNRLLEVKKTIPQYCDVTLLNKITYPTGGYSIITYETNEYGKIVKRFDRNRQEAEIRSVGGICGGARVSKIEDYDDKGGCTKKEYKYCTVYPCTDCQSSGILTTDPVYASYIQAGFSVIYAISMNSFQCNFNAGESHIAYSTVTEVRDDNSYSIYKFSSDIDLPNRQSEIIKIIANSDYLPMKEVGNYRSDFSYFGFGYIEDNLFKGKLLSKTDYDNNHKPVKKESYNYNFDSRLNRYEAGLSVNLFGVQSYKIAAMPCLLTEKTDTIFETSDKYLVKKHHYQYNDADLMEKETVTGSDGRTQTIAYRYVDDVLKDNNSTDIVGTAFKQMKDNNMIGIPVEIINYTRIAGQEKVYDASTITYQKLSSGIVCPLLSYKLSTESVLGDYAPFQISAAGLSLDPRLSAETGYELFDIRGNLLQKRMVSGVVVSYLWSYNYLYPVAQIVNADYQAVKTALSSLGLGRPEDLAASISPDFNRLKQLKDKLPEAFVSIYAYNPFIGIKNETGPRGYTSYYFYDASGKLITIRDHKNNILKKYQYHLKGQ